MKNIHVLVIDDEKNILESVEMVLAYEDYHVETAGSGLDGIEKFKATTPEIVLLDVKMPGFDGLEVLKNIKHINPLTEVVMISGHSGIEEAVQASKLGAFDFLEKPISRDKLILTVRNAAEKISLLKENYDLKSITQKKYRLVGKSPVMEKLKQTIEQVAKSDSTVLVSGESGTGKELISRNIHSLSRRSNKPFVQVNCAAIPEELIESELFGHEKGSFTGAYEKKIGKFESAHGGSIFLDEVGDLSQKAQAKVLRVLEEGEIQRVGSPQIKTVDVRIIAATNKNLEQEIKEGHFREDLFFRLNVIPLHSPALRERREDIPVLIDHFVTYFSEENNYRKKSFAPETIEALKRADWKGNVRELRNLVERLLIMVPGKTVQLSHLPDYLSDRSAEASFTFSGFREWKEFKRESEKRFIEEKLAFYNYNIAKTAREINLPRSNLYKKIESLDIMIPGSSEADKGSPDN